MCAVNRGASGAAVAHFLRFLREIFTTGRRLKFTRGTETPIVVQLASCKEGRGEDAAVQYGSSRG